MSAAHTHYTRQAVCCITATIQHQGVAGTRRLQAPRPRGLWPKCIVACLRLSLRGQHKATRWLPVSAEHVGGAAPSQRDPPWHGSLAVRQGPACQRRLVRQGKDCQRSLKIRVGKVLTTLHLNPKKPKCPVRDHPNSDSKLTDSGRAGCRGVEVG